MANGSPQDRRYEPQKTFAGKFPSTDAGDVQTPAMAKAITRYLIKSDYSDNDDKITAEYHDAKTAGCVIAT